MIPRVLLYGATGYSGKLIAREAAKQWGNMTNPSRSAQVVLAARNGSELGRVCRDLKLEGMELALGRRAAVVQALSGFHVVINAAGPFALTADRLARAALEARCHYVDISGETGVYERLDDLSFFAHQRNLAIVCGAGEVAAASDFLVDQALQALKRQCKLDAVGSIRIAVPRIEFYSRGSAQTALQWTREQVPVARSGGPKATPLERGAPATAKRSFARIQHVPIGQLERTFDFGGKTGRATCSAVAMIDVMTAMRTARRQDIVAGTIEVYMAMKPLVRAAYDWAAIASTWLNLPPALRWTGMLADQLPDGPSPAERERTRHTVLLEIESVLGEPLIDWRLDTPNCYTFTARSAVAVAQRLWGAPALTGWRTPAETFSNIALPVSQGANQVFPFTDCLLTRRKG